MLENKLQIRESIIYALRMNWTEYTKLVKKSLDYSGFNDDGDFFVLDGYDKITANMREINAEVQRDIAALKKINEEIAKEQEKSEEDIVDVDSKIVDKEE